MSFLLNIKLAVGNKDKNLSTLSHTHWKDRLALLHYGSNMWTYECEGGVMYFWVKMSESIYSCLLWRQEEPFVVIKGKMSNRTRHHFMDTLKFYVKQNVSHPSMCLWESLGCKECKDRELSTNWVKCHCLVLASHGRWGWEPIEILQDAILFIILFKLMQDILWLRTLNV